MMQATLCMLVDGERILLGLKKRGFGEGKYNGFGGKVKSNETIKQAAIRELHEESGLVVEEDDATKVGELSFYFSEKAEWNQVVHVYLINKWQGEPTESEEMAPYWFESSKIPYDKMWDDDKHWLPLVLQGKKLKGEFTFGEDNSTIINYRINEE